jgi:LysM repeat protein
MRYLLLTSFVFCCVLLQAQRITRAEYIEKYSKLCISEMKRSGVPASIKMAQACLESDDGNSMLAKDGNNHFGIKCHSTWTGDKIYKDDDAKNECFRKYKKAEESFKDHTDFLMNTRRYASLFELKKDDYKGWAKGLKEAGYATNPKYPEMLIKIIEDNKLYELDKGVEIKKDKEDKVQKPKEQKPHKNHDKPLEITIGGREIRVNNMKNYIVAKQGDTYEGLTKEFDKLSWELYRFNDVTKDSTLKSGQWVYLQPKRNKAERGKETHVIQPGESIHSISQQYGIKVKSILKKNKLDETSLINAGDTLYLRKIKPAGR